MSFQQINLNYLRKITCSYYDFESEGAVKETGGEGVAMDTASGGNACV